MKNKFFHYLLLIIAIFASTQSFAKLETRHEDPNDKNDSYKCHGKGEIYTRDDIKNVGTGLVENGKNNHVITFCYGETGKSCYMTENNIDTTKGQADYMTLLTASITGHSVQFYCNKDGWAQNIRYMNTQK